MSSNELCKACTLLEGLERGMANSAIVRSIIFLQSPGSDDLQTDRARKKLDAQGPAPENLRTIPFFKKEGGANTAVVLDVAPPSLA
jgi:cytoplasmic tRNA 2-thiolation protein 1